jgi:xanthine/uracil permease
MAATRVYSTAAYWVAGVAAVVLSFSPKFGELIASVPLGVLGGASVALYGLIAVLGARIWVLARVDFGHPVNLLSAAVPLVIGVANFQWKLGHLRFTGIAIGTVAAVVIYHALRIISSGAGTLTADDPNQPTAPTAPVGDPPAR